MVSIIIVNYKVKKELLNCLKSIIDSEPKTKYEIIVIDNDNKKIIKKDILKNFPKVVYLKNKNNGFGQANNLGAKFSRGKYLFFLNPDTLIQKESLDNLLKFINTKKDIGIASPVLLGTDKLPYQQGSGDLNPISAIFTNSFINKIFPNNPIAKKYYHKDWNFKQNREVNVAPGTAFLISRNIFNKVGGFDEKFFLYFEEFDLCRRVKSLGYKIYITPSAKVTHFWGRSTAQRNDIKSIFLKSRYYYFRKHFGFFPAVFTELFLRINKYFFLIILALLIGIFLRIYRINETMPFIGEQGWFYLSAKNMLVNGSFPLVGIPSSHPWLHQGPLWTYLLASQMLFFGFSPYVGVYLSIFLDVLSIYLMYVLGRNLFNRPTGVIAMFLYAISNLTISNSRMPYHTSPIPLLTILLTLSISKWLNQKPKNFILIPFYLSILYNLELATVVYFFTVILIFLIGIFRKSEYISALKNKTIIIISIFFSLLPLIPILIHDINNGFPQTIKFAMWMGYRILLFFGFPPINNEITHVKLSEFLNFCLHSINQLIFLPNAYQSLILFIILLTISIRISLSKKSSTNLKLSLALLLVPLIFFLGMRVPSYAYLPMLIVPSIIICSYTLSIFIKSTNYYFGLLVITAIISIGFFHQFNTLSKEQNLLIQKIEASRKVIQLTGQKEYNLKWDIEIKKMENITSNYQYLIWWLGGKEPNQNIVRTQIIIKEKNKIEVIKKEI